MKALRSYRENLSEEIISEITAIEVGEPSLDSDSAQRSADILSKRILGLLEGLVNVPQPVDEKLSQFVASNRKLSKGTSIKTSGTKLVLTVDVKKDSNALSKMSKAIQHFSAEDV